MSKTRNPLRGLMYISVFVLVFDILGMYLDLTAADTSEILGIPFHSRGSLNPIAPFRIACIVVFLYLYRRYSKYAWHTLIISILLDISAYWILRWQGIYFETLETAVNDWFRLGLWALLLVYVIKLLSPYMQFISSNSTQAYKAQQAMPDSLLDPHQIIESCDDEKAGDSSQSVRLRAETQVQLGKLGAAFILIYSTYYVIVHRIYLAIVIGVPAKFIRFAVISFTFAYAIPVFYLCGLATKRLRIAKMGYRIWLIFVLGFFLFVGFRELVLKGNFSIFPTFWGPLGIITIVWWVGVRGLTRIVEPQTKSAECDTIANISMYIGIFLGFFCGSKITHDFLASYWPEIPHYDKVRSVLPCLVGAAAGSLLGGYVGAFIGAFIERLQKAKTRQQG
jgi:hypothetical protein